MKLYVPLLATTAVTAKGGMKEWEVQDAYFADEEIILADPKIRNVSNFCQKFSQRVIFRENF